MLYRGSTNEGRFAAGWIGLEVVLCFGDSGFGIPNPNRNQAHRTAVTTCPLGDEQIFGDDQRWRRMLGCSFSSHSLQHQGIFASAATFYERNHGADAFF